jgi:uncharacterized protein
LDNEATLKPIEPIPPTQPSTLRNIFIGKDGLRAGWSLLVFVALFAAVAVCVNVIGHKLFPPAVKTAKAASDTPTTPHSVFVSTSIGFLVTLLVTWIMSKIERRPNSVYGFGGTRKVAYFFAGLAWGISCLSLLVLILWKTGLLVIDGRVLFSGDVLRYGVVWLLCFLLVGLFEEYNTRGYLQYTLARGFAGIYQWLFKTRHSTALGFWTAAVFFSILFGLGHSKNPGESPIGVLSAGLAGMVYCFSLWRTGSLWWAIGFHTSWDWSQSFLYGVADSGTMVQHHLLATYPVGRPILSGGATGPEGSIFIVAIVGLISLIILFTLPRAHHGEMPERST